MTERTIFALLDAARIGVTLTPSFQMLPRKSTSLVLGSEGAFGIITSVMTSAGSTLRTTATPFSPSWALVTA